MGSLVFGHCGTHLALPWSGPCPKGVPWESPWGCERFGGVTPRQNQDPGEGVGGGVNPSL